MLVVAGEVRRARLEDKTRYRPTAAVEMKMPKGSATLAGMPERGDAKYSDGEEGTQQWQEDFSARSHGFSTAHRAKSTDDEHVEYMSRFGHWLHLNQFGEYVEWKKDASGKMELVPVCDAAGVPKVPPGQAVAAWLLDHATGNTAMTPKGGRIPTEGRDPGSKL